ncbi:MAG: Na/Pi symporter [Verrucomicrobiota bacterium]|nr:Na/Pi symporter [Verrucomicrobiota bacterium]
MEELITAVGGLGFFLFGMAVMTSGLKKLAGERMHHWLGRATNTPVSGALTGATVTAIVQSSSATTAAAIGFVGAGLMTFQALGILFGANIGTIITGWAVALLGFKLKLGEVSLPLLFIAALLYLNKSRRRLRGSGKALAGFALIFLGIDFLQTGISGARDWIDLSDVQASAFGGRVLLVLIGIALTLITQSSSPTVGP